MKFTISKAKYSKLKKEYYNTHRTLSKSKEFWTEIFEVNFGYDFNKKFIDTIVTDIFEGRRDIIYEKLKNYSDAVARSCDIKEEDLLNHMECFKRFFSHLATTDFFRFG